jgi:hypothetical protein
MNNSTKPVLGVLNSLAKEQKFATTVGLSHFLNEKVLPELKQRLKESINSELQPWIAGMVEELSLAYQSLLDSEALDQNVPTQATLVLPKFKSLINQLAASPSVPPRNELRLARDIRATFAGGGEIFPQLLQASRPSLAGSLYGALGNISVTPSVPIKVYAMRVKAPLFANNAPNPFVTEVTGDGAATRVSTERLSLVTAWAGLVHGTDAEAAKKGLTLIGLDALHEQIKSSDSVNPVTGAEASYALIDRPVVAFLRFKERELGVLSGARSATIHKITQISTVAMAAGMSFTGKVTQLGLDTGWLANSSVFAPLLSSELLLRGTQVYAQSELLALADDPIEDDICDHFPEPFSSSAHEIELDGLYDGLKPGRWLIISGQRTDVPGTTATP